MRLQHHHTSYADTYPARELTVDAEPLLRMAALAGRRAACMVHDNEATPSDSPTPGPPPTPTPDEVWSSSAAAAESIDTILADLINDTVDRAPQPVERLTTSQAAAPFGVSRPTLVAWLKTGRIPFHRCGTPRRVNRSEMFAYRDRLQ